MTARLEPFSFEHTWEMKEEEYVPLDQYRVVHTRRTYVVLSFGVVLGVLLLLWRYSVGFGLLLLAIIAFVWTMPRVSMTHARDRFKKYRYLHGPVSYGVSSRGVWVRGAHFSGEADWDAVATWREEGDWLVLSSWGIPPVYLPMAALKQNHLYRRLQRIARQHGVESRRRSEGHSVGS